MSRRVLVTGGTRGIGAALVTQLLARGDSVLATGRTPDSVAAAAKRWPSAEWRPLDLATPVDWPTWLGTLPLPRFDLVILNAGIQVPRDFTTAAWEPETASIEQELQVNLAAPIGMARALPPVLAAGASIVFVTSGLALAPKRSSPVYCASKAGLRSFTKSLRAQWAAQGWRVIEALPPLVDTDMTRGRGHAKLAPEAAAAQLLSGVERGQSEIDIGATRWLRLLLRLSPALGERVLRDR